MRRSRSWPTPTTSSNWRPTCWNWGRVAAALDLFGALAADPATSAPIAAAVSTWRAGVRYGLWLVADPVPAPGIGCIDLLTGHELYVAVAPEQADGLARWSVLGRGDRVAERSVADHRHIRTGLTG